MSYRYIIEKLTKDSCSIGKIQVIVSDDVEYEVGKWHYKAYENSIQGRLEVEQELEVEQINAVMEVWGNTPTAGNVAQ